MGDLAVPLPTRLDALGALRTMKAISALRGAEQIVVDASALSVPEPFGMLYLGGFVQRMRCDGQAFRLANASQLSYAAHMGLFGEFSDEFITPRNIPRESDRYISLTRIGRAELNDEANHSRATHVGEIIEKRGEQLAKLLTQLDEGSLVDALTYCLREIIRNSYEHSRADDVTLCGQYRPSSNRVDLAFGDVGCGIRATLTRNPRVKAETDREALSIALLPGISGGHGLRRRSRRDDPWANSGYGLYMTHRLCKDGGVFTAASGTALLRVTGDHWLEKDGPNTGTVIGLTMRLDALQDIENRIPQFSAEGREISQRIKGAAVDASVASVSLRMSARAGEKRA